MENNQILDQLTAIIEAIQGITTQLQDTQARVDALEKRYALEKGYKPPIKTCEVLKCSLSLLHEPISISPPFSTPLAQNDPKESDNDQVEVLIYEPNLDDFDLFDDDIDDQIGYELVDDAPTPPEEVIVDIDTTCKVITDSDSCILVSTTARLGSNFALHSCHASLDFVLPSTKPLPQVDPVLLVLFQSDIPQKICFFHSGRLGEDTRFLPPLTRVYELWEKLAHPLCSWPGD